MINSAQYTDFHIDQNNGLVIDIPSNIKELLTITIAQQCKHLCQERQPSDLASIVGKHLHDSLSLNKDLLHELASFSSLAKYPYLIVKNLIDLHDLPPTPIEPANPPQLNSWHTPAAALLGVLHLTGHVAAAFADETDGRLSFMVAPIKPGELDAERSIMGRDFHTEIVNGYFPDEVPNPGVMITPEIISLMCLRNPQKIATTILPLHSIIKHLNYSTIMDLMRPEYTAMSQPSFTTNMTTQNIPIISKDSDGNLRIRYSHSKLIANTNAAKQALKILTETIAHEDLEQQIPLNPGDLLIVNNKICLHGRKAIGHKAKLDDNGRWLIRMYGYKKSSLEKAETTPDASHIMQSTKHSISNNNIYQDRTSSI